jgi:hypothetical protein
MVDIFAEQAKAYWRMWGPLGDPMVRGIEACSSVQNDENHHMIEFRALLTQDATRLRLVKAGP